MCSTRGSQRHIALLSHHPWKWFLQWEGWVDVHSKDRRRGKKPGSSSGANQHSCPLEELLQQGVVLWWAQNFIFARWKRWLKKRVDGGDGYTMMRMCLTSLKCTFKWLNSKFSYIVLPQCFFLKKFIFFLLCLSLSRKMKCSHPTPSFWNLTFHSRLLTKYFS